MRILILAGGFNTRLAPVTDSEGLPKPLLRVGTKPPLVRLLSAFAPVLTSGVNPIIVSNARHYPTYQQVVGASNLTVLNDGAESNEQRLGAVGDLAFAVKAANIDDSLLVVAGDQVARRFNWLHFVTFWLALPPHVSLVATSRLKNPELASGYGIVQVDAFDQVVDFEEKPIQPKSDLAATAIYIFNRAHVALVHAYLQEANERQDLKARDQIGQFVAWLARRGELYAYEFAGEWYDIGDLNELIRVDELLISEEMHHPDPNSRYRKYLPNGL